MYTQILHVCVSDMIVSSKGLEIFPWVSLAYPSEYFINLFAPNINKIIPYNFLEQTSSMTHFFISILKQNETTQ